MTIEMTIRPEVPFPFTMRTTGVLEHSRGIAWTADLFMGSVKVGTIEQDGDGGADYVSTSPAYRALWRAAVNASFAGDEERATYYLLVQEGGA